jgi:hypothetical protein
MIKIKTSTRDRGARDRDRWHIGITSGGMIDFDAQTAALLA